MSESDSAMPGSRAAAKRRADADGDINAGAHGPRKPRKREIGGADGLEPTRYGDWERNGRCTDF